MTIPLLGMEIPFLDATLMGNTAWQYLLMFTIIIASLVLGKIVHILVKSRISGKDEKKGTLETVLGKILGGPIVLLIFLGGLYFGFHQLSTGTEIFQFLDSVLFVVGTVIAAWLIIRFFDTIADYYLRSLVTRTKSELDEELLPVVHKSIKAVIVVLAVLIIFDNLGYDVTAIIAGLGIGGLAIAFAAKDTIENVFGGFSIFLDRPFKLKDRVKIGNVYGNVVEIGLRRTRIKTLENTIVTIPNSQINKQNVENYYRPDVSQKVKFSLALNYNTSTKKIKEGLEIIKKAIKGTKGVIEKEPFVKFLSFGESSLNILVIYWVKSFDYKSSSRHDVNMKIKERFEKAGIEFAYPTRTVYLEK